MSAPLPKPTYPTYTCILPMSKKEVKYRAFNVREQRNLLTAQENMVSAQKDGKPVDIKPLIEAVCSVIKSASGIDANKVPVIDTEFLILKIKAAATGSELKFQFTDNEDGEIIKVKTDINDFDMCIPENFTTSLKMDENSVVEMRLPTIYDLLQLTNPELSKTDRIATVTANCIAKFYQGDAVYDMSEYSVEDKLGFLDEMLEEQLAMIADFFENAPKMRREIKYKKKNGTQKTLVIEGMKHFFL